MRAVPSAACCAGRRAPAGKGGEARAWLEPPPGLGSGPGTGLGLGLRLGLRLEAARRVPCTVTELPPALGPARMGVRWVSDMGCV